MTDVPAIGDPRWRQAAIRFEEGPGVHGIRLGRYCRAMGSGALQIAYDEAAACMDDLTGLSLDLRFSVVEAMLRAERAIAAVLFPWPWRERFIVPTSFRWLEEHPDDPIACLGTGDQDLWLRALDIDPTDSFLRRRLADALFMDIEALCAHPGQPSAEARAEMKLVIGQFDRVVPAGAGEPFGGLRAKVDEWRRSLDIDEA